MLAELSAVAPQVVDSPEGRVQIWAAGRGMVFTRCSGRVVLPQAEAIMGAVDSAIRERPGQVVAVHDLLEVDSYEINVHTRMSAWSVSTFRAVRRVVIAVRSPFVSLAVRTINLAVGGGFEVVDSREELLKVAQRELTFSSSPARAERR